MRLREVVYGIVVAGTGVSLMAGQTAPVKQMFVFGDSYSDTGAGYIDGNGPTAVWYLAKDIGIELVVPQNVKPGRSVNFAVSGALTGAGAGERFEHGELVGYGMRNQVNDFAAMVRKGEAHFAGATTLFYLAGGLNDRSLPVETSVANIEGEIETLYGLGARRFQIALLPEKLPGIGTQGVRLNPALKTIPIEEKKKHEDIQIAVSDWGPGFDTVFEHAPEYGISNTKDACAGRALFHQDPTPCSTPKTYYFYHANHPSTHTHEVVGGMLAAAMKR